MANPVLTFAEIKPHLISSLMGKFNLMLNIVDHNDSIPGSFWGESEAGLIDNILYVRPDTPVHSLLHEGCHYICMDESRRSGLDTDAGGDYDEENAVCYLQIILADHIDAIGKQRMFKDMDSWGYTFRLGSAEQWFNQDAEDAKQWLLNNSLLDQAFNPTYKLRS